MLHGRVCLPRVLFGRDGGLELEVDALAAADLPEVGFLIIGDVVGTEVKGCQCPDNKKVIRNGTDEILILAGTWGGRQRV